MSTITTLASGDNGAVSRSTINTNFVNLNTDKFEKTDVDVDTTMAANSDTKVPSQKAIKAYVDANASLSTSSESTTGTTHSLTTNGTQRVIVWAKGNLETADGAAAGYDIKLNYNGVQKDIVQSGVDSDGNIANAAFSLMYTETPSAGTQNITVTTSGGLLENVVILVQKFNV